MEKNNSRSSAVRSVFKMSTPPKDATGATNTLCSPSALR